MNAPQTGGQPPVDLEALRAHILTLGSPPTLTSVDAQLPDSLRDVLTAFPHGTLQGAAGSGPPEIDPEGTRLTLSLVCASQEWPAGTAMALVVTGVRVTVTAEGATTLLLDAVHDKTDVTATVTADGPGRLAAAVRPVQPGAFAGALETLGRAFAGDAVWAATAAGLQEFAFSPDHVAGFDYRLDRKDGAYSATSMAVVAALDLKAPGKATALGLDISLWFPDLRVTGRLRGGEAVDVRELLTSFGMPVAEVPDGLGSAELSFAADLGDAYLVRTKLTGTWEIAPGLTLRGLSLDLSYSRDENFVARFGGTVSLGQAISIDVSAAQVGGGQGWSFYGGLTAGTSFGIRDVVSALGLTDVPGPVESLALTSLWVSHTTGTVRTEFFCQGDLTIADGLTASLGAAVTRDSTGVRYGGTLDVDGFRFNLLFDTAGGGTDVFVATYRAAGDDSLRVSLRDWIAALFPEAADGIPADLSIALDSAKFARVKPPGGAPASASGSISPPGSTSPPCRSSASTCPRQATWASRTCKSSTAPATSTPRSRPRSTVSSPRPRSARCPPSDSRRGPPPVPICAWVRRSWSCPWACPPRRRRRLRPPTRSPPPARTAACPPRSPPHRPPTEAACGWTWAVPSGPYRSSASGSPTSAACCGSCSTAPWAPPDSTSPCRDSASASTSTATPCCRSPGSTGCWSPSSGRRCASAGG